LGESSKQDPYLILLDQNKACSYALLGSEILSIVWQVYEELFPKLAGTRLLFENDGNVPVGTSRSFGIPIPAHFVESYGVVHTYESSDPLSGQESEVLLEWIPTEYLNYLDEPNWALELVISPIWKTIMRHLFKQAFACKMRADLAELQINALSEEMRKLQKAIASSYSIGLVTS
jgi:hypothetical protein